MSEVTYKKIVDVEQIDALGEGTTLFVNDGGSMKQMGAAALGAVKSVNGVLPDENGDIEVSVAEKIAFVYMPEMGDLLCEKTAAEIHELYSNVATAHGLCFILRVYDFTDPMASTPDYLYNKIEVESIQNGETYYKLIYHIHFGDVVPPVLVDAINNTITLDPDWVKPATQPDWNQNDPNAPDYVKNRTHWVEITEAVTEVPDTAFTSTIDAGQGVAMLSVAPNVAAIGDKREIIYDGVSYVCEAAEFKYTPGVLYLGNASIMGAGDDSGEPFFWMLNSKTSTTFVNMDTVATAHTISCKTVRVETVHPLDPKYLPEDHINGMIDSKLEGAGAGAFVVKLTWNEDGTITTDKTYDEAFAAFKEGKTVIFDASNDEEENVAVVTALIGRELVATQMVVQDETLIDVSTFCFVPSGMRLYTATIKSAT